MFIPSLNLIMYVHVSNYPQHKMKQTKTGTYFRTRNFRFTDKYLPSSESISLVTFKVNSCMNEIHVGIWNLPETEEARRKPRTTVYVRIDEYIILLHVPCFCKERPFVIR